MSHGSASGLSDFGEQLDDTQGKESFVPNDILTYIQCYINRSTADNIKKVICQFYAPEAISEAKSVLWEHFGSSLGRKQNRQKSLSRDIYEADATDIIAGFQRLDRAREPVTVRFVTWNLENIPKYKPDETENDVSVARISQNEQRIRALENRVDSNNESLRTLQMLVQEVIQAKPAAPYAEALKSCPVPKPVAPSMFISSDISQVGPAIQPIKTNQQKTKVNPAATPPIPLKQHEIATATSSVDIQGFTVPTEQRRRAKRREAVIGKRKHSVIKSGAKYTHLFVSRVFCDVTDDEMKQYICDEGVNVIEIKTVSHEEARMKSFKITIETEEKDTVMSDSFWPAGIACREFYGGRNNNS